MKEFLKLIFERFGVLIVKMVSIKFFFAVVASVLLYLERIDSWVWFMVILSVMSVRAWEKKVDKIQIGRGGYGPPE